MELPANNHIQSLDSFLYEVKSTCHNTQQDSAARALVLKLQGFDARALPGTVTMPR